jgi:hypothetical protein
MAALKGYDVAIARSGEVQALLKSARDNLEHTPDASLPQLDVALKRAEALIGDIKLLKSNIHK